MAIANIQINSVAGSNTDLPLNVQVNLTTSDTGTYQWSLVSQPSGSPAVTLSGDTTQSPYFTPTKEGSYLIKLVVDSGLPTEKTGQVVAAIRELMTGNRIPAVGETIEADPVYGWGNTAVDEILQRVTRFSEAGVLPGVAGAAGLAVGDVVYASDVYTLAAGLPGARDVASWTKAQADSIPAMQGVFGILAGSVNGGAIASGDVINIRTTGLYQGVTYSVEPSVGDAVYISDTATLSLTKGTINRQIGTVCAVDTGASTYDVMVGPAPAELATTILFAKTYWVSTTGSDVVGDGSINNPFATPQKAHDVALVDYPTDWVSVQIGPGSYVGDLTVQKWNIIFHGAGSRPETQATKILGVVTVAPDLATQKFNDVVGLDSLYVESATAGTSSLVVGGVGAFSCIVTDCYLTTYDSTVAATVQVNATNVVRPRVTLNDCIVTVQLTGPDIVSILKGDVRISNTQMLFGSTVSSGAAGKGITIANDATLFADRLLLDIQTIGPGIEVTGSYAGAKLTLSNSAVTLSYASCSHGISVTNGSPAQLAAFVFNTVFGVANGSSKAIYGSGSLGTNIVTAAQLSYLYGTSSGIGSAVTLLGMTGDVAGGDLSGNLPSPTVAKIQGRAVSSTAPASGEVLGWNGSAWAPTSNSSSPTGAAGGVLGYTGSTYPNPSGLAANGSNKIPIKSPGVGTTVTVAVDLESTGTGAGLTIAAGEAVGSFTAGEITVSGGAGTVSTGTGGAATLQGGAGNATGGDASVLGGSGQVGGGASLVAGAGSTTAGNVQIAGGTNSGGDGGDVSIEGGTGSTNNGDVGVGVLSSNSVLLGRVAKDVRTYGRSVGVAVTYAPVAGTTIPVTSPVIILAPVSPVTMTATPTLQTSGIAAGTSLTLIGGANAVTLQRESALAGSGLRMANPTQTFDLYDVANFIFDGVYWREASHSSNS